MQEQPIEEVGLYVLVPRKGFVKRAKERETEYGNKSVEIEKKVAIALHKQAVEEEISERQNSIRVGARVNQKHVQPDANAIIDVFYSTLNKSADFHRQESRFACRLVRLHCSCCVKQTLWP